MEKASEWIRCKHCQGVKWTSCSVALLSLGCFISKSISHRKNQSEALRCVFASVARQKCLMALKIILLRVKLRALMTEQINTTCLDVQARHGATPAAQRGLRSAGPIAQIHSWYKLFTVMKENKACQAAVNAVAHGLWWRPAIEKTHKPLGFGCRLMLFLKSLSTSKSGLELTCVTTGACSAWDTQSQSIWRISNKLGQKCVHDTREHRTVFAWVSVGTSDLSETVTLEALDPAELDWAERLFVLCDDRNLFKQQILICCRKTQIFVQHQDKHL